MGSPGGSVVKNLPADAEDTRDVGLITELGRSLGGGNGNPFQYSCLKNLMDREVWQATVHGVSKNLTLLRDWACFLYKFIWSEWFSLKRLEDLSD